MAVTTKRDIIIVLIQYFLFSIWTYWNRRERAHLKNLGVLFLTTSPQHEKAEESRDELQRALQNYHGGRISWKRVQENHPLLAHFSTSALRAQAGHMANTRL